jgi:hypothetical protein
MIENKLISVIISLVVVFLGFTTLLIHLERRIARLEKRLKAKE